MNPDENGDDQAEPGGECEQVVNIVGHYPFDMDLRAGRHVVDAKSILGIFSLDLSRPITLEIYSDDCEQLLTDIQPFVEEADA